jgi:hypothetical protein
VDRPDSAHTDQQAECDGNACPGWPCVRGARAGVVAGGVGDGHGACPMCGQHWDVVCEQSKHTHCTGTAWNVLTERLDDCRCTCHARPTRKAHR